MRENAQNALNSSLDYQRSKKEPQKISELKPYIYQYNWKGIKFPSDKEDWKKFEQDNKEIALNVLFLPIIKKKQNWHIHQNITTSVKNKLFC